MPTLYISFCPQGHLCTRGGGRLGADRDEATAKWRVLNHLQTSTYHNLSEADAEHMCEDMQFETEEVADNEGKGMDKGVEKGDKGMEKGDKGHGKTRYQPYQQQQQPQLKGGGRGKDRNIEQIVENAVTSALQRAVPAQPSLQQRLCTAVARAEAAARTSARMARSAASAFEEEASHLRAALEELGGSEFGF